MKMNFSALYDHGACKEQLVLQWGCCGFLISGSVLSAPLAVPGLSSLVQFAECMISPTPSCAAPGREINEYVKVSGGRLHFQSVPREFKGSIPFHSWTVYIDELSLFCSKSAGQSCGSEVCLSLGMLNTHLVCLCCPARPAQDRDVNQEVLSLFSSGEIAPATHPC